MVDRTAVDVDFNVSVDAVKIGGFFGGRNIVGTVYRSDSSVFDIDADVAVYLAAMLVAAVDICHRTVFYGNVGIAGVDSPLAARQRCNRAGFYRNIDVAVYACALRAARDQRVDFNAVHNDICARFH